MNKKIIFPIPHAFTNIQYCEISFAVVKGIKRKFRSHKSNMKHASR